MSGKWWPRLNGPQTYGRGPVFWTAFVVVVALLALGPELFLSRFQVITYSQFLISAFLALSLCLIWGYSGILSLGQAAFYGIGGYAYGIVGINLIMTFGDTHLALLFGILIPVVVALILGIIMFYAELKGVYIAILMLVFSLLIQTFMVQTADPIYKIGGAHLGGANGLRPAGPGDPRIPNLTFGFGDWSFEIDGRGTEFYYFVLALLVVIYLLLRWLLNSTYGYILVGVREDEERAETFGYDTRLIKLSVFCISAAIAGLGGALYTAWGTFVHPDVFSVQANILPVIWVAIAGRKDITAAIVGALFLEWLSLQLTLVGEISLVVLGGVLVLVMLLTPQGLISAFAEWNERRGARRRHAERERWAQEGAEGRHAG